MVEGIHQTKKGGDRKLARSSQYEKKCLQRQFRWILEAKLGISLKSNFKQRDIIEFTLINKKSHVIHRFLKILKTIAHLN